MRTGKIVILLGLALFYSASAWAITITPGPGNFPNDDNVLFSTAQTDVTTVTGTFNGSGNGFLIDFTSTSGSHLLSTQGMGQATVLGGTGNNPFTNLSFNLENGATFTTAILNPDVSIDGMITFTVSYILGAGSPHVETFSVDGNGENFFRINADGSERITQVTFDLANTDAVNAAQFRLGGFAAAPSVPDSGATLALLGTSLVIIELLRRTAAKRALTK